MILKRSLFPLILGLGCATSALHAQNFIPVSNFQSTSSQDNLWDGVDGDGYLCGETHTATALNDLNRVAEVTIPISVSAGDMNGDGLPDLVTAGTTGYFQIYFNVGTKTEPKFTTAETAPIFLSRRLRGDDHTDTALSAPRIDLYDMSGRGNLDLVVGFYGGSMMVIPNTGSRSIPAFRQPTNVAGLSFPTSSQNRIWANLLAPAVIDWNRDGKTDILVGDGSYSANSVFLMQNQSSGGNPKFSEEGRSYLVYGNGRAQLSPTVADYNGDGLPDVIAVDRKGEVTVNLNESGLKTGTPLQNSSAISLGGASSLRSSATVKAVDLNGDGKFDLVFGKANGRIAVSYNTGSKEQPQFGPPQELKGQDVYKNDIKVPTGCSYDVGFGKGNFYAKMTVVTAASDPAAQPPSGQSCLKVSYDAPLNKIIKFAPLNTQPSEAKIAGAQFGAWGSPEGAWHTTLSAPVRTSAIQFTLKAGVLPDVPYQLSFNIKGRGCSGQYMTGLNASGVLTEGKVSRGDRGSASTSGGESTSDADIQEGTFTPGPQWSTVTRAVTFHFKRSELNKPKNWKGAQPIRYAGTVVIRMDVDPFEGVCYVDNVQFTARK